MASRRAGDIADATPRAHPIADDDGGDHRLVGRAQVPRVTKRQHVTTSDDSGKAHGAGCRSADPIARICGKINSTMTGRKRVSRAGEWPKHGDRLDRPPPWQVDCPGVRRGSRHGLPAGGQPPERGEKDG